MAQVKKAFVGEQQYNALLLEFKNYRQRTQLEKKQLELNGGKYVVESILPAIDDIERAIQQMTPSSDAITQSVYKGICLAYVKLMQSLEKNGVKPISAKQNQEFSPHIHEAVGLANGDKNTIVKCVQTGYQMNEELVRPSKVIVGNGK